MAHWTSHNKLMLDVLPDAKVLRREEIVACDVISAAGLGARGSCGGGGGRLGLLLFGRGRRRRRRFLGLRTEGMGGGRRRRELFRRTMLTRWMKGWGGR